MAREKGTNAYSSNLEPQKSAPLDARMVVSSLSDLVTPSTWISNDGSSYLYSGMIVGIGSDPISENNGVYVLKNVTGYTSYSNWLKIGNTISTFNLVNNITEIYNQTQLEKLNRYNGQTYFVINENVEYWFLGGTDNVNLIKKSDVSEYVLVEPTFNTFNVNLNTEKKYYCNILTNITYNIKITGNVDGELLIRHIYSTQIVINIYGTEYVIDANGESLIVFKYYNGVYTFGIVPFNGINSNAVNGLPTRITDLKLKNLPIGSGLEFTESTLNGNKITGYSAKYSLSPNMNSSEWNSYNIVSSYKIDNTTIIEKMPVFTYVTDTNNSSKVIPVAVLDKDGKQVTTDKDTNIVVLTIEGIPIGTVYYIAIRPFILYNGVWIFGEVSNIIEYNNVSTFEYGIIKFDESNLIDYKEDFGGSYDVKYLTDLVGKNTVFDVSGNVDTSTILFSLNNRNSNFNLAYARYSWPYEQILDFKTFHIINKIYLCNQFNSINVYGLSEDYSTWENIGVCIGGDANKGVYHILTPNKSYRFIKLRWEQFNIISDVNTVDYSKGPDGHSGLLDIVFYGIKSKNLVPETIIPRKQRLTPNNRLVISRIGICNYTWVPIKLAKLTLCVFKDNGNGTDTVLTENQGVLRFFDNMDRYGKYPGGYQDWFNINAQGVEEAKWTNPDLTTNSKYPMVLEYKNNEPYNGRYKTIFDVTELHEAEWNVGTSMYVPEVTVTESLDSQYNELKSLGIKINHEFQFGLDIFANKDQSYYGGRGILSKERRLDNVWEYNDSRGHVLRPDGNGLTYNSILNNPMSYKLASSFFSTISARYGSNTIPDGYLRYTPGRLWSRLERADRTVYISVQVPQTRTSGHGGLFSLEIDNETDNGWAGNDYPSHFAFNSPLTDLNRLSAIYDGHLNSIVDISGFTHGVKNVDSNILVTTPGYAGLNIGWIRYMMKLSKTVRPDGSLPFDVFNQHHYSSMSGSGQYGTGGGPSDLDPKIIGVNGEMSYRDKWVDVRDRFSPSTELWITEYGYDETTTDGQRLGGMDIIGRVINGRVIPDKDKSRSKGEWIVRSTIMAFESGIDIQTLYTLMHDAGFHETTPDFYMWDELMSSYVNPGDVLNVTKPFAGTNTQNFISCGLFGSLYDATYPISRAFWYWSCFKNTCGEYMFEGLITDVNNPTVYIASFSKPNSTEGIYAIWNASADNTIIPDFTFNVNGSTTCTKTTVFVPIMPNPYKVPRENVFNPPPEFYPLVAPVRQPYDNGDGTIYRKPDRFDYQGYLIPQVNAFYDFITGTTEGRRGLYGDVTNVTILNDKITIDVTESPTYYKVNNMKSFYSLKIPKELVIEKKYTNNILWFNNYSIENEYELFTGSSLFSEFSYYDTIVFNGTETHNQYIIPNVLIGKYLKLRSKRGFSYSNLSEVTYVEQLNGIEPITGLSIGNISNVSAKLSWSTNVIFDTVEIFRGIDNNNQYLINTTTNVSGFTEHGLEENKNYIYSIRLVKNGETSEMSNFVTGKTDYNSNYGLTADSFVVNYGNSNIINQNVNIEIYPQTSANYYRISETIDNSNVPWVFLDNNNITFTIIDLSMRTGKLYLQFRNLTDTIDVVGSINESVDLYFNIYKKEYIVSFQGYSTTSFDQTGRYNVVGYSWQGGDFDSRTLYDTEFNANTTIEVKSLSFDLHANGGWSQIPTHYPSGSTITIFGEIIEFRHNNNTFENSIDISNQLIGYRLPIDATYSIDDFSFSVGNRIIRVGNNNGIIEDISLLNINYWYGNIVDLNVSGITGNTVYYPTGITISLSEQEIKYDYPTSLYQTSVASNGVYDGTPTKLLFSGLTNGSYNVSIIAPNNVDKGQYEKIDVNGVYNTIFNYKNIAPLILKNVIVSGGTMVMTLTTKDRYTIGPISIVRITQLLSGVPTFTINTKLITNTRNISLNVNSDYYITEISISEISGQTNFLPNNSNNNYTFLNNTPGLKTIYVTTKSGEFVSTEMSKIITYDPLYSNYIMSMGHFYNESKFSTDFNNSLINNIPTISLPENQYIFDHATGGTLCVLNYMVYDIGFRNPIPMSITLTDFTYQDISYIYPQAYTRGLFTNDIIGKVIFSNGQLKGYIKMKISNLWGDSYKVKVYTWYLEDTIITFNVNNGPINELSVKNNVVNYILLQNIQPVGGEININVFSADYWKFQLLGVVELEAQNSPLQLIAVAMGDGSGDVNIKTTINIRSYGSPNKISITYDRNVTNWINYVEGEKISFTVSELYNKIYVKLKDINNTISNTIEYQYNLLIYNPFLSSNIDSYFQNTDTKTTSVSNNLLCVIPSALAYRYEKDTSTNINNKSYIII